MFLFPCYQSHIYIVWKKNLCMLLFICCIAEKLEDKCYFITAITEFCVHALQGLPLSLGL